MKAKLVLKSLVVFCLIALCTSCVSMSIYSENGVNADGSTTLSTQNYIKITKIDGNSNNSKNHVVLEPGYHRIECDVTNGFSTVGQIRIALYFAEGYAYTISETHVEPMSYFNYRLDAEYNTRDVDARYLEPVSQEALNVKEYDARDKDKVFIPVCNIEMSFRRESWGSADQSKMMEQLKQFAYDMGANTIAYTQQARETGSLLDGFAEYYIVTALVGNME